MRRFHSLLVAAVTGLAAAIAGIAVAQAQTEYRGRACIFSVNQYCEPLGYSVGQCANVRFRPPNAPGNGNQTRLSIYYDYYAQNFRQEGSAIGGTFQDVIFSWLGSSGGTAVESQSKWRIPLVQPADFGQAWLHMIFDIFRYDDFGPGEGSLCYTRWRFTGVKRPDPAATAAPADMSEMDAMLSGGLGNLAPAFKAD
ncbi:hypothetical protein N1F89_16570 [Aquibium sp. A9E412]|uniref:hypothetical protein n=1 Tax=Aquibium sp. A9E412 TaxID=2976767 RepID=UPI0025AFC079|nr:hypothetical protein [Aquibium sp. A9E412]MDN2567838.1 hypothetical protein [Aquibium sp. A9E412]